MSKSEIVTISERISDGGGRLEGLSPLAGRLDLSTLLVREAVQNSWDARDDRRGEDPVHFAIDGWDLDGDRLEALREFLPVKKLYHAAFGRNSDRDEGHGVLHPSKALERKNLRVLIISDRNTVGLCGPIRSGTAWNPVRHGEPLKRGQQRFANFVRNMGRAASNTGAGDGGAYGVGKSSLWMASECGTILIHSRTTNEKGKPVERFIGSIHGEYFVNKGLEYSGRHFIGRDGGDGVVDPLEGSEAQRAARMLHLPKYVNDRGDQVDGTSIVIIAPRFFHPWDVEMARLRDAVRWHVWPKRVGQVRGVDHGPDMKIRLSWNNNAVDIPNPMEDVEIKPYAAALLDCARSRKSSDAVRDVTVRCGRPVKVLGEIKFRSGGVPDSNVFHLTGNGQQEVDEEPVVDFETPWGMIAMIRREPLLLVRYEPIGGPEEARTEVGVFLSADDPEVESALTKAEPPAHDDWSYSQVPKDFSGDHRRTFVKMTLDGIKRGKQEFVSSLRSANVGDRGGGEHNVSQRLSSGLFGGFGGKRRPDPDGTGGGGTGSKPKVRMTQGATRQNPDGSTAHEVNVEVLGVGEGVKHLSLTAGGAALDNTGTIDVGSLVSYKWETSTGELVEGESFSMNTEDGTHASLVITIMGSLRFRPKIDVEVL